MQEGKGRRLGGLYEGEEAAKGREGGIKGI